ncbi:MAG: phage head closure protein [Salinarimonas sp.]
MRAGSLNRRITIERPVEMVDAYGAPSTAWHFHASVRADVVTEAVEIARESGAAFETTATIRLRHLPAGVALADRVILDGIAFDVVSVVADRRRETTIKAVVRGV